jgi:hypothetical protein
VKLATTAVYTTSLPQTVFDASRGEAPSDELREGKRWVSGLNRFQKAQKEKVAYPVLFSDSRRCANLVFWATIVELKVSDVETTYRFKDLKGLRDCFTQDLVLCSEKRNIAPNFIRPYALVMTPDFLMASSVAPATRLKEQEEECLFNWDEARLLQAFSHDISAEGWYELDRDGDVVRRPLPRRHGQLSEKIAKLGIKREPGYLYQVGEDSDGKQGIYRMPMA